MIKELEQEYLPLYNNFDNGHGKQHALDVINTSDKLAKELLSQNPKLDLNMDIVYTSALMHDLGLQIDRESHHLHSGKIVRESELQFQILQLLYYLSLCYTSR